MGVIQRIRRDSGLTEQALANQAGVSKNYIQKLEHATYAEISTSVLSVLSECSGISQAAIMAEYYEEFQNKKNEWDHIVADNPPVDWEFILNLLLHVNWSTSARHPYAYVRGWIAEHYGLPESQIKWAQMHGIHPALLSKYELHKTILMPPACRDALINSGCPVVIINTIIEKGAIRV